MYLHLGQEYIVNTNSVLGIFDLDTCTVSKHTRNFLSKAEKSGKVINTSYELPKSFVLCMRSQPVIYISQLSSTTLKKRIDTADYTIL